MLTIFFTFLRKIGYNSQPKYFYDVGGSSVPTVHSSKKLFQN